MKKFLLTAMISFGAIEASAYSYLNTTTFGNTSVTTGNIGSNSVYIRSNNFGNTSRTYGSIGSSSIYANSNTFGNTTRTSIWIDKFS